MKKPMDVMERTSLTLRKETLISDLVKEKYKQMRVKDTAAEEVLQMLEDTDITTLSQWNSLPSILKNKYPELLTMVLDKACQQVFGEVSQTGRPSPPDRQVVINQVLSVLKNIADDPSYQKWNKPPALLSPFSLTFPFVGRSETSKALLSHICKRLDSSKDKMQNTIPYIACCGGMGKSRYLHEQQRALLAYCDSDPTKEFEVARPFLQEAISVNITFHNGNNITPAELEEARLGEAGKPTLSKYFAVRLLAAYFLGDVEVPIHLVIDRFTNFPFIFDLALAVECILRESNSKYIVIGVDEYSALLREGGILGRNYLKKIVADCGALLSRRDIFSHVLFAGTTSSQFAQVFTESSFYSCKVPMNLLSFEETKQVIESSIELPENQGIKTVMSHLNSNIISAFLGGHARSIEILFLYLKQCAEQLRFEVASKDLLTTVMHKTITDINSYYNLGAVQDPIVILCYWALRTPLKREVEIRVGASEKNTLDRLEREGFLILSSANNIDEYFVELPVAWLHDYSRRLDQSNIMFFAPLKSVLDILIRSTVNWQDLEEFAAHYYLLRITSAIILKKESICMSELDWPTPVDKILPEHKSYSFKISRSNLITTYGRVIAARLMLC